MDNNLEKKYGLPVAICMVVGIIIGSGIFIKADSILEYTNNNPILGVIAWIIGGLVMLGSVMMFSIFASKYSKVNGIIDYSEYIFGKRYTYYFSVFLSYIYYPSLTSVLGWITAKFTLELFGIYQSTSWLIFLLSIIYILLIYLINLFSPKISGILQVSSTIVKLIPIILVIIVGIVIGLISENQATIIPSSLQEESSSLFHAICACAFAYEGWIISTSINSELKDSKRNLPLALIFGCLIVMAIYILFFIGILSSIDISSITSNNITDQAIRKIFGVFGNQILKLFIVISCIGTLNGLMIANIRSKYSMAIRGLGLWSNKYSKINKKLDMPIFSTLFGLIMCILWFFYFYFGALQSKLGFFNFDSSELPIITIYLMYIPLFIVYMVKEIKKGQYSWKSILFPIIATICSIFMVVCSIFAHGVFPYLENGTIPIISYSVVFSLIMIIAIILDKFVLKHNKNH